MQKDFQARERWHSWHWVLEIVHGTLLGLRELHTNLQRLATFPGEHTKDGRVAFQVAHLNDDCAERPDITLHRVSALKQKLRTGPGRGSYLRERICWHAIQHLPQTEVCNLAPPFTRQQNIWTFNVQVADRPFVKGEQARSNVLDDLLAPTVQPNDFAI